MWEGQGINAPAPGQEDDLATSAQAVDGEKHLVPCEGSALPRDLFEVTGMSSVQYVEHLSFYGRMLCHAPPIGEQNALLLERLCIVGATGWSLLKAEREFGSTGVTGLKHAGKNCTIRQVEEFRVSDKSGDCCQIPQ
jgi:hypothetical protein